MSQQQWILINVPEIPQFTLFPGEKRVWKQKSPKNSGILFWYKDHQKLLKGLHAA